MRARNIKPGFFTCPELIELPFETRLLFAGLWSLADREGRLEDRPAKIKIQVFPGDEVDVDLLLDSLAGADLIQRYEVDGAKCIQVVNFMKHQRPHSREIESVLSPPGDIQQHGEFEAKHNLGGVETQPRQQQARSDSLSSDTGYLNPDSCISGQAPDTQTASEDVKKIYDHWNGKENLVSHRRLTDSMKRHVNARLEDYSVEEITGAIDNYAIILASKDHLLDHRWTLAEFLTRAFDKFLTANDPFTSYKKSGGKRGEADDGRRVGYGKP